MSFKLPIRYGNRHELTSSASRASSGSVWCVNATIASTDGASRLACSLATGTASANTTPWGLRAEDNGVDVVHTPMRPTVTPPTVTVLDRGSRSRNALVASPDPDPDPVSPSLLDDSSGYGTDASDASAADAAAADASSSPGGHANT